MSRLTGILLVLAIWFCGILPVSAGAYINRYPQSVTRDMLSQVVNDRVAQEMTAVQEKRRYKIEVVQAARELHVPDGALSYEAVLPNGLCYGRVMPVQVNINIDGTFYRKVNCSAIVHVYDQVVVTVHTVLPERILQDEDLRIEDREIADTRAQCFGSKSDVTGHVTNRMVRDGTVLTANMLRNPVILLAGSPVTLVANINGVQIKTDGVALQDGRADNVIRVRNVNSGKMRRGRVMDAVTVEVLQ